jgi:hypothetical protein
MKTRIGISLVLMALAGAAHAGAPPASLVMIPPQINYQGRLVTTANAPYLDTTHTIDLVLYPTASGGTRIWGERYSVLTRDGYFSVNLGSGRHRHTGRDQPTDLASAWKTDGASPDTFFMALTVRTETNGTALATPVEATPRQQFLTLAVCVSGPSERLCRPKRWLSSARPRECKHRRSRAQPTRSA